MYETVWNSAVCAFISFIVFGQFYSRRAFFDRYRHSIYLRRCDKIAYLCPTSTLYTLHTRYIAAMTLHHVARMGCAHDLFSLDSTQQNIFKRLRHSQSILLRYTFNWTEFTIRRNKYLLKSIKYRVWFGVEWNEAILSYYNMVTLSNTIVWASKRASKVLQQVKCHLIVCEPHTFSHCCHRQWQV